MATAPVQIGPHVWLGPDLQNKKAEWIFRFTEKELEELKLGADKVVGSSCENENYLSLDLLESLETNFTLPTLYQRVGSFLASHLMNGRGFFVWRGIPVKDWDHKTTCAAFLLLGRILGGIRRQNGKGHVLGHVKNLGLSTSDPNVRNYQTNERNTFHVDWADVVGLLCLRGAKSGGESLLVSSAAIFNELTKTRNDLASELFHHFPMDYRGEGPENKAYFSMPVFTHHQGYFSAYYQRKYINSAQRYQEARKLTEKEIEALDVFDELVNDPKFQLRMTLEPGDVQFLNNLVVLHDRTSFIDWDERDRQRHLLRVWMSPEKVRPLPPYYAERFGSVEAGDRGGVNIPGVQPVAPLVPE